MTIQEILDSVKAKVTFVYDAIYPHYKHRVEGIVLDVDWWLAQDLGVKLERKRLIDAMSLRKKTALMPESVRRGSGRPTVDEEAVQRVARNKPEAIVEAVNELSEAERKAIKAQIAEGLEPLKESLKAIKRSGIADMLDQLAEDVLEGTIGEDERQEIRAALDKFILAFEEACWKMQESK